MKIAVAAVELSEKADDLSFLKENKAETKQTNTDIVLENSTFAIKEIKTVLFKYFI